MKKLTLAIATGAFLLSLNSIGQVEKFHTGQVEKSYITDSYEKVNDPFYTIKSYSSNKENILTSGPGHITRSVYGKNIAQINGLNIATRSRPVYVDSTVLYSIPSGQKNIDIMKAGSVFDPLSIYWTETGTQILSQNDPYTIDSLFIGASYKQKKKSIVDTLVVELTWGLITNSSKFSGFTLGLLEFAVPNINPSPLHGDVSFLAQPSINYRKFKLPLTSLDTIGSSKYLTNEGYLIIPNVNQLIPKNNISAVSYYFKPGSVVAPGSVVVQYSGGVAPATENGITGRGFADLDPGSHHPFYDETRYANTFSYFSDQRYGLNNGGLAFLNSMGFPEPDWAWDIGFSVSYVSSVGVNELEATGSAVLNQNVPNPFTNESVVEYQLNKEAHTANFTVTDIMGRVTYSETVATTLGKHFVKLGSHSPGVYYYTLTVDGKSATKKMLVQ